MSPKPSAAVIGSGIAGLTAAYELQKAGWKVTVYERRNWSGGRMANLKKGQMLLETGATEIFSFYREMLQLIEELDLTESLVSADAYLNFHIKGNDVEYDFNYGANSITLLGHSALSWRSKIRLPGLLPDLLRFRRNVDPCLIETAADYDDEDLNSYLVRKIGQDFVDGFVAPVFRLFWRWQPDSFSRAYFLAFFAHTLGCRIYTFREGIGQLSRRLTELLDVRLGCDVQRVERSSTKSGWAVTFMNGQDVRCVEADVVISAVEAFQVPRIFPHLDAGVRAFFESVRYTQSVALHYLLNKAVTPGSTIFTVDSGSPLLSFARVPSGFPGFPGVPDRLWVSLTPEYLEKHADEYGSNLDAITRPHVRALYPGLEEDLIEVQTQFEGAYLVLVYPGYIKKVREFERNQARHNNGVYFCGDFLAHPHTGGACASGKRVALRVIQHFKDASTVTRRNMQ